MRVPTLNSSQNVMSGIATRQGEQARLQQQLATGQRINTPGDDPAGAAQAELARSRLTRLAQDQRSQQLSTTVLSAADAALGQGVGTLQSVRESLVAAANGSYSLSDRQALALQLRSARDSMVALANTSDSAGGYVFAGQGSDAPPLTSGATPAYGAVAGEQRMGDGGRYAATVDGNAAFMMLPQGNGVFVTASNAANTGAAWIDPGSVGNASQLTGHSYNITVAGTPGSLTYSVADATAGTTLVSGAPYTDGGTISLDGQNVKVTGTPAAGDSFQVAPAGQQSIFKTLDDAIATLEQPATNTAYSEKLERVQTTLDRALDSMINTRSRVGDEMKSVDNAASAGADQTLQVTQRKSNLQDLDFAGSISALQSNQTALEAALKTYANVAKTSLFQML
ncbi:MAG: flagellar hook-associated protein FlgL [Burkholderiaceae bacterium]|nr:flagellar hook-associated protein FlgL [Burkholderiaceae bacterium]